MPWVTILCQIKSKELSKSFINRLANYYNNYNENFNLFLYDLKIKNYVLLYDKYVFNHKNIYVISENFL